MHRAIPILTMKGRSQNIEHLTYQREWIGIKLMIIASGYQKRQAKHLHCQQKRSGNTLLEIAASLGFLQLTTER
ncbi:hypothetical protein GY26_13250 [Gammaproteobacteria bacterium MFB021]|nr:hypothetical protein GY26_13250 [Gammaproteobacteria bacterium MFB021]